MAGSGQRRYRFGRFVVSPSRRVVLRDGREVPLIPRYFDLLTLLVARRGEAIHRQEIFDTVWRDVVVSDGALSQAVRSLRRVLDDDPKQPTFIRTVPRHGYRFVYAEVIEEDDSEPSGVGDEPDTAPPETDQAGGDTLEDALARLLRPASSAADEEERRDAAERIHALDTAGALGRLDRLPGHAAARALLRDARWDVAGAGKVPILGQPGALRASAILVALRLRRVRRLAGSRWLAAVTVASAAGLVAAFAGAMALRLGPGSAATNAVFMALPLVGLVAGGVGAAGVAGGLVTAEVLFRSRRAVALVLGGALGGGLVGATAHLVARWALEGLFGGNLAPTTGGVEGLVIGGTVGLGYALATPTATGGMAAPHGVARLRTAVIAGATCALGTALMAWSGRYLGAMSLDLVAHTFPGSQVGLGPLARLLGEPDTGPLTRVVASAWEGLMFGTGLVLGLTRRPHSG